MNRSFFRRLSLVSLLVLTAFYSSHLYAASPPFTLTDALGRSVHFDQPPQRIVLTGKAFFMIADALYLFPEAQERVVAMGIFRQSSTNFIKLIDPDGAAKTVLEPNSGAEHVAAFQPDAVILKSYLAESMGKPIETLGIPVVYLDLETPEQYMRDLRILGQLFGRPDRAEEVIQYYHSHIDTIQTTLYDVDETQKPRVVLLNHSEKDGVTAFRTPPRHWMQTRLVELAGGVPVWGDLNAGKGWTTVNLEQILAWDADVVVLVSYSENPNAALQAVLADATWQATRAAQTGRIYVFPGDLNIWDQPNPRWIMGLLWLAQTFYPERFAEQDILAELRNFYAVLYGLDSAFFETHIRPILKGDLR